jgi:hypothetical protein
VLGHSGQSHRFSASIRPVLILLALVFLAMLTRVTADWVPLHRMSHYLYAAPAWIIGVLIWPPRSSRPYRKWILTRQFFRVPGSD